jgi:hypothetical protein
MRDNARVTATRLVAIATSVLILATVPVVAFEVRADKNLTGGSVRTVNRDIACGHAKEHRGPMFSARRDEVLRRYGMAPGTHPDYEIDHLIPLCLGGSDDTSNLWPQPRRTIEETWNAEAKDRLERLMCNMACEGQIDIASAQQAFATDWIAAYQKYFGGRKRSVEEPVPSQPPPSPPNPACPIKGNITNKGDRIYHKPGDRDYDRVVMKNCDHDMCAKGKRWFCSTAEAEAAGWRRALR